MPHFSYRGEMMVGMSSFKAHCGFGFWKAALLFETRDRSPEGIGQFGKIRTLADLPSDAKIVKLVKAAAKLNEVGIKVKRPAPKPRPALTVPADLAKALAKNRKAKAAFDAFAPSQRREYIEWLIEAKREETRARRLATALEWIAEGKPRHWKYQPK
jgi:uncharacterized protein YdeI (YjbR/CyaY-like superfamily)